MTAGATDSRPAIAVIAFLALLHGAFIGGGWVTDDIVHVTRLQDVHSPLSLITSPDGFNFYRPIAQVSLWLNGQVLGFVPAMFRAVNVLMHAAVCLLAYALALRLVSGRAAFLTALAFTLTPKAATIAALWASARPELIMSGWTMVAA